MQYDMEGVSSRDRRLTTWREVVEEKTIEPDN